MSNEVTDLRKGERFRVVQPLDGALNGTPVSLLDLSVVGAQILHSHPVRIGTRTPLTFKHDGTTISVSVLVVWSHLSQSAEGLRYKSGVKLIEPDVRYAAALNSLIRSGAIALDVDSLERKRQRELDRQQRRQSGPKFSAVP